MSIFYEIQNVETKVTITLKSIKVIILFKIFCFSGTFLSVEIMNSFQIIDTNEDGRISKQELRNAAFLIGLNPTKRELEAWWREADTNSKCLIIYILRRYRPCLKILN